MAVKTGGGAQKGAETGLAPRRVRRTSPAAPLKPTAGSPAREASSPTDVWQARVAAEFGAKLMEDAEVLGLSSKTDIVKAALELLHRQAAELRMARGVEAFYGDGAVPLPVGVVPLDESELDDDPGA